MTEQGNHETGFGTTRRDTFKLGGGAALAMLAAGIGGGSLAIARQATPAAGSMDGAYAVVRLRQVREDHDGAELLELIRDGYVPLAQDIPAFISSTAIADPASRSQAFIAVFADKAGADESTVVAGEWLEDNGIDHFEGDPIIAEGEVAYAIAAEAAT